jgi:hypothetical protein
VSELEAMIKRQSHPWWKLTLQDAFDLHIKIESRVRELLSCCTIEAMLANPNVNSLITQHEKTIRELEAEIDRLRKLYKKWGYADAPCSRHSKQAILNENNCASCRADIFEAERDRLRTDLSESLQKQIQMALDALIMKRNHAELVEAANKFRKAFVIAVGDKSPFAKLALEGIDKELQFDKLKAALAEVK